MNIVETYKNDHGYWTCRVKSSRGEFCGGGFSRDGAASDAISRLQGSNLSADEAESLQLATLEHLRDGELTGAKK